MRSLATFGALGSEMPRYLSCHSTESNFSSNFFSRMANFSSTKPCSEEIVSSWPVTVLNCAENSLHACFSWTFAEWILRVPASKPRMPDPIFWRSLSWLAISRPQCANRFPKFVFSKAFRPRSLVFSGALGCTWAGLDSTYDDSIACCCVSVWALGPKFEFWTKLFAALVFGPGTVRAWLGWLEFFGSGLGKACHRLLAFGCGWVCGIAVVVVCPLGWNVILAAVFSVVPPKFGNAWIGKFNAWNWGACLFWMKAGVWVSCIHPFPFATLGGDIISENALLGKIGFRPVLAFESPVFLSELSPFENTDFSGVLSSPKLIPASDLLISNGFLSKADPLPLSLLKFAKILFPKVPLLWPWPTWRPALKKLVPMGSCFCDPSSSWLSKFFCFDALTWPWVYVEG